MQVVRVRLSAKAFFPIFSPIFFFCLFVLFFVVVVVLTIFVTCWLFTAVRGIAITCF